MFARQQGTLIAKLAFCVFLAEHKVGDKKNSWELPKSFLLVEPNIRPSCLNKWDFDIDTLPTSQFENDGETVIYQETKLYAKWVMV